MSVVPTEVIRGHCPACGPEKRADVVGHCEEAGWDDMENMVHGRVHHRILKCCGCEAFYHQKEVITWDEHEVYRDPDTDEYEYPDRREVTYWPAPSKRRKPEWLDELPLIDHTLAALLEEIYVALNNDLRVMAAIGIRTAFERASDLLKIDPAASFPRKLQDLLDRGKIGTQDKDVLAVLANAGHAAAHRGWKPRTDELDTLMWVIEGFVHRAFILNDEMKHIGKRIPARPKARKRRPSSPPSNGAP